MNIDFTRIADLYRVALYAALMVIPAIGAGYLAIEEPLPKALVFAGAVVSALSGGVALKNFTSVDDQ